MKKFSSFLSIVLTLAIVFGNFSLPVFAYDKGGVNFEQARTKNLSNNSRNNLNKINSSSQEIKNLSFSSSINAKEKTGLEKSQQTEGRKDYVEGEILVKYKDTKINLNTTSGRVASLNFNKSKSLEKKEDLAKNNISVLKIKDAKTVEQKIAELKNDSNIEYAQPNFQYYSTNISSNDTYRTNLWGLDNTGQTINGSYGNITGTNDKDIDAPEAWAINEGTNSSTIVAVIDSGVAYNHPDLINNMWNGVNCKDENGGVLGECNHGYDYEDGDNTPLPTTSSHGTHVAGTIAAVKNNTKGIIGVAPQAKIMALKSSLTTIDNVKSINFAKQNGAKVINASWATYSTIVGGYYDVALYNAIGGFPGLFVVAAGNGNNTGAGFNHDDGVDTHKSYPAGFKITTPIGPGLNNIISVAATDQNDALSTFSDYGATSVDVGSPGTNIYSTIADTSVMSENFNSVTTPNLPNGWIKGGINNKWATYDFSGDKVLYGQVPSFPYDNDTNSVVTSSAYNLSSNVSGATINFDTRCDTEYTNTEWFDYMALEVSSDGINFTEILKWDEATLDYLNGDSSDVGGAFYSFEKVIPTQYLSSNFKFRLRWFADPFVNEYDGCWVDDVKITKFSDGSDEKYGYYDGTSMATPHVAGLASLIEGYNPSLTSEQVKNAILTTGDSVASLSGKTITGKRINAQSALQSVNPAKVITAFNFIAPTATGVVINETDHTISATVPFGTNVAELIPTITITGVSVSPLGGVANNFTTPQTYTVTAADGSTQSYIVSVVFAPAKTITSFTIPSQVGTTTIDEVTHTILLTMPFGTNVTALTPTIIINGASVIPNSGVTQNFINPVTYTVTSADSSTQAYIVTVVIKDEVKLTISKGTGNPNASTIEVSDTSSTNDILMLEFRLKATGSDIAVNKIAVGLTGVVADVKTLQDMLGELKLKNGASILATVSTFAVSDTDTVTFDLDEPFIINTDSTQIFRIYVDVKDIDNFSQGDSLKVDYASIIAKDTIGNNVDTITGGANGETQTFYSKGIVISNVITTTTVNTGESGLTSDSGTFSIRFNVTAFGDDMWIDKTAPTVNGGTTESDLNITGAGTVQSIITTNGATSGVNGFLVSDGDTQTFTITTNVSPTTSGFFKVKLTDLLYALTDINGNLHYINLDSFETSSVYLNAVLSTLSSIAITHPANELSFTVGDSLGITGLVVTGTYSDASTQIETITASNITGFDSSAPATDQVLTITVGGKTTTYTINIVTVPEPDVTAPVITLNGNNPTELTVGDTFTDPGATASDNVDGNITTNIVVGGDIVDVNIVGTYIITYNVSDTTSNPAIQVTRTVNVNAVVPDTTSPVIEFHGDFTTEATSSEGAVVNYTAPNTTDNEDATEPAVCLPASGTLFVLGSTEVTCNKTDSSDNEASPTTFNVIVEDTTPPEITLNGDTVINLIVGDSYSDAGATASDIVDGELSEIIIDNSNVDTSKPGSYSVTYNISDATGNPAVEVIRTINVSDAEAPVIDSALDITTEATGAEGATVIYDESALTATDDIDGVISVEVGSCVPVSGSIFVLGTTSVSCSATDSSGNEGNSVAFSVIIEDTTAPEIIIMGSTPIEITVGDSYSDAGATVSDIVDGDLTGSIVKGGDVVDTLTIGNYVITYNASDSAGNNAVQVTRTVIVNAPAPDTIAPFITLVGSSSMSVTVGNTFYDPGATALDNVDGNLTSSIVVGGSVNTDTIGDYTLTYDVSDTAGNEANQITRTVHVVAVVVLNSIAITHPANELSFTVGDSLGITGLVVTGTYSDATTKVETVTVSSISGFDSSVPVVGQVLTVTFEGKTTTYTINIVAVTRSSGGGGGGSSNPPADKKGDNNGDGKVDKYDFSLMMANWGKTGTNTSDFNGDGKVDKYDFALLMSNWGL